MFQMESNLRMKQHARLLIRHYQQLNNLNLVFDRAVPALQKLSSEKGKFVCYDLLISVYDGDVFLHGSLELLKRKTVVQTKESADLHNRHCRASLAEKPDFVFRAKHIQIMALGTTFRK